MKKNKIYKNAVGYKHKEDGPAFITVNRTKEFINEMEIANGHQRLSRS